MREEIKSIGDARSGLKQNLLIGVILDPDPHHRKEHDLLRLFSWNCFTTKLFLKLGVINIYDMNIKKMQ